jgi:hypothetical protein
MRERFSAPAWREKSDDETRPKTKTQVLRNGDLNMG